MTRGTALVALVMGKLHYLARWVMHILLKPYYLTLYSYPVWYYVVNRTGRILQEDYPKEYTVVQERIIRDLKANGFAVAHLDELFPGERRINTLSSYVEKARVSATERDKKKFLKKLWPEEPSLDSNNPFMALGYDRMILEIVNAYIGVFSHIVSFWLDITVPVSASEERVQSQRWHRDPGELRMCKMFVYVNDVDESAGPFTYVSGSHYGGRYRKLFPQDLPRGCYPPEGAVEKVIPDDDIKILTGRAGTIIFADTTGLHRGGYATAHERIMFTCAYTSTMPSGHRGFKSYYLTDEFKKHSSKLNPLAQYALRK